MAKKLYVYQLPAGTNFTWMDRRFVVSDMLLRDNEGEKTDSITNGFITVREIRGVDTPHSWLGEPEKFHADVEIERPDIVDWLKQ